MSTLNGEYYRISRPAEDYITIIAKVSNCCNLDCQYCYDKPFRDRIGHNGVLDIEKLRHTIDMASKYAKEVKILWHGGEPTLAGIEYYRKVYEEILDAYPYVKFDTNMQTNGVLLNNAWCDFCSNYGIGVGSSYQATQENLRHNIDGENENTALVQKSFCNVKNRLGSSNIPYGHSDAENRNAVV